MSEGVLVIDKTAGDWRLVTFYHPSAHSFEIRVIHVRTGEFATSTIRAQYEPRFGIDVADRQDIDDEAEKLIEGMKP